MSFALDVKDDLNKAVNPTIKCDMLELEAYLRFSTEIILGMPLKLAFTCNNMGVVRRFIMLLKKKYNIEYEIESRVINRFDNHTVFTCNIENANAIIEDFSLLKSSPTKTMALDDDEMTAYLRGAFLVRGSVNDPASKNSHLEIITNIEEEILFIQKLMNHFELNCRLTKRKNYIVAYIKAKESIGDFLYRLGATNAMSYYENMIITKEIKATAQRTINLDLANQEKTNASSREQIKYIEYLQYNYPLEELDSKLLMIMKVRMDYPEHSLSQLLDIIHDEYDPNLSKSGLNHRLRKIKEIALEHMERKK